MGDYTKGDQVTAIKDFGGWSRLPIKKGTMGVLTQADGFVTALRVQFDGCCHDGVVQDDEVRKSGDFSPEDSWGRFTKGSGVRAVKDFGGFRRPTIKSGTIGAVTKSGGRVIPPSVKFDGFDSDITVDAGEIHLVF